MTLGQVLSGCATSMLVPLLLALPARAADPAPTVLTAGKRLEKIDPNPYPSTYQVRPSPVTALVGATVYTGTGQAIANGTVIMQGGKILSVSAGGAVPAGAMVIDAKGKFVTPGIIDNHSHLGDYPVPEMSARQDGNELTAPNTAEVWAEHSIWPQDPAFLRALAGGVTTMQILPGSANLFGGRAVTIKNVWARTVQAMKFPGAPYGLKMACGENPKRVYGDEKKTAPATNMGNMAGYRDAWIKAIEYQAEWDLYRTKAASKDKDAKDAKPPKRDLELDTLTAALRGEILVHMHCYRADEMAQIIDMSKEFGYRVSAFHHAVESYKIADLLAKNEICSSMWADWWGFKMESLDGIEENIALVHAAGACAIVHSDSNVGNQRLNQEGAKSLAAGRRMGLNITDAEAWTWLSLNPAKSMGIADKTGSLEPDKMADLVLWTGDPFSVYTRAEKVYIDGALAYDLNDPAKRFQSDFELGYSDKGAAR